MQTHDLSFLKDKTSVYYAGLDYRAFPFAEASTRLGSPQSAQIIYLKALALLVDHVAIPPAFLISAMDAHTTNESFLRAVGDLFQDRTFVTAVHGLMNDPVDFYWHKLESGDKDERQIFVTRRREATAFLREVPLIHRDIPSMSSTFRDLLLANLVALSDRALPSQLKDSIRTIVAETEARGEVALSRMDFISLLNNLGLTKSQYRACYYAMNAAYYRSGAVTYHSDIACLSVEEFSVLGSHSFNSPEHGILIGYDPSLFLRVLRCHGVSAEHVHSLDVQQIDLLKSDPRFLSFTQLYRDFVSVLQTAQRLSNNWPKWRIAQFKESLLADIEARFHAEQRRLAKWVFGEDVGSGLFTALLGAVIGFAIAGPPGAVAGAGVGFVGPMLKLGRISVAEVIASKLADKQFSFFLYIEYLREKIEKARSKHMKAYGDGD